MPDPANPSTERVIIFEFDGGAYDGQALRSDEPPQDVNDARTLWALTRKGLVGRRFDMALRNRPRVYHRYKIMGKFEQSYEVCIKCRYVGESDRPELQ